MTATRVAAVFVAASLFTACAPSDAIKSATKDFEAKVELLRKDETIVDWVLKPSNIAYDIKKSDSALTNYEAVLRVNHYQGEFTAIYVFHLKDGKWVFARSEKQAPLLIDAKIRRTFGVTN